MKLVLKSEKVYVLLFLMTCAGVATADLSTKVWSMDQSNVFSEKVSYGKVTVTGDTESGKVEFKVEALDTKYYDAEEAGIMEFGFNFAPSISSAKTWSLLNLPSGWSQDNNGGRLDGFGIFRVTEGEKGHKDLSNPLVFSFVLPTAQKGLAVPENFAVPSTGSTGPGQPNVFFTAHVIYPGASHYIGGSSLVTTPIKPGPGTMVPAPGAMVLGVMGVGLVGWMKRRLA